MCCWINFTLVLIEVAKFCLCYAVYLKIFLMGAYFFALIVRELICLCSYKSGISPLLDSGVLRSFCSVESVKYSKIRLLLLRRIFSISRSSKIQRTLKCFNALKLSLSVVNWLGRTFRYTVLTSLTSLFPTSFF